MPRLRQTVASFNGATPVRAWKQTDMDERRVNGKRFNGATPVRAWKHLVPEMARL